MTQLLISVKNVAEALLVAEAGVDIIDLKDPNIGALGAIDLTTTAQIVAAINGRATISATAGEGHSTLKDLIADMEARANLGVEVIKIVVSPLFTEAAFKAQMLALSKKGIKIVAVFFADEGVDMAWLAKLKQAGFYGAMIDTQKKQSALHEILSDKVLGTFANACQKLHLVSGFAGSVKPQHIDTYSKINPIFIGMRGGVCENDQRKSSISLRKINMARDMLCQHNKNHAKAQKISLISLQT